MKQLYENSPPSASFHRASISNDKEIQDAAPGSDQMTPDQNKNQIKREGAQMGHTGTQTSLPSTLLSSPCLSAKGGATPRFSLQIAGCEHQSIAAQP